MRSSAMVRPLAAVLACLLAAPAAAAVFVNELHYDDSTASGDTGEGIEVVATAGEDLSGYSIHLYNGSSPNAAVVYNTKAVPAGNVVQCGGQVRIAHVAYPVNTVQNGPADGLALVDGNGQVVQFLSYEGQITAANGPAAGMGSQNLPVSETNSTASGTSLQLRGSGASYDDFSWAASSAQSFGACNSGQQISGSAGTGEPPAVTATLPVDGASDVPAAGDLSVTFSEAVSAASGAFVLQCASSGSVALSHPAAGTVFALQPAQVLQPGESCQLSVVAARISDGDGQQPVQSTQVAFSVAAAGGDDGYYSRVNTSSPSQLRCSLHATIRDHTSYPYSGSGTSTWTILEIADEDPNDSGRILDIYRNRSYPKVSARAGTGSGLTYNREHTWPKSLGFSSATGDKGLPYAPHTDTHMLYLSDTNWNSSRGNKPLADCSSGCTALATEANNGAGGGSGRGDQNWFKGPDGNGGSFETWDERKGDIARAVMYMAIRYEGGRHSVTDQSEPDLELTDDRSRIVATSSSPAYMGLLSTLLQWHQLDPPDAAERARNEVIHNFQGNRNPFIDHPEWASQALFTSARPASCQLAQ